jgi:Transposase
VRRFLGRFGGQRLEVLVGDDRLAVRGRGAAADRSDRASAEPADTAALKGNKKHAKNDRADARHLRELLMAGRLPDSWIPPAHILDLRARVRLRHTLSEQRGERQRQIQSVLYHTAARSEPT